MTRLMLISTVMLIVAASLGAAAAGCEPVPAGEGADSQARSVPTPAPPATKAAMPPGFRILPSRAASGEVLATTRNETSAVRAIGSAMRAAAAYFDAPLRPLHAVATPADDDAQSTFVGRKAGRPVRGYAAALKHGGETIVVLLYDAADRFALSFGPLMTAARASLPAGGRAAATLQRQRLADGSGAISVPPGWQLSPINGMVSGKGPEGAIDLGVWAPVTTPQAAAMMMMRPPLVVPFGDPAVAYRQIGEQMLGMRAIEVLDQQPITWWQGPSAMLHVRYMQQGARHESLAMVLTSAAGGGQWMYYVSSVSSPSATFAQYLPTLMNIWTSWKTDDRVFQQRLQAAADSMKRVGEIIREANDYRQDVMDRSARAWDYYIRGEWPIEDRESGRRADVDNLHIDKLVEGLNREAGYERYRPVPFELLNK